MKFARLINESDGSIWRALITAGYRRRLALLGTLAAVATCTAQVTVPGADGSDGAFNPTSNTVINLALADTAAWDGPNPNPGEGVYDVDKWAIVFRYSSVNIPTGVSVSFLPHPSGAPVVWLVDGPVVIGGGLNLGSPANEVLGFRMPGPGGFRGSGDNPMGGLGPGGGNIGNQEGSYATGANRYGNSRIIPLIGGSGGGGRTTASGCCTGQGGGGAILIAATGTVTINGNVQANGHLSGQGGVGSGGGAIRVITNRLQGSGNLRATGAGQGRIRLEVNELAFGDVGDPIASFGLPGETAQIWPDSSAAPSVRVLSIDSEVVPADPRASFEFPNADLNLTSGEALTIVIETRNVPTGTDPQGTPVWNVVARITPRGSANFNVNAMFVSGTYAQATWHATVTLPNGFSAIQVRASMPQP